MQKYNVFAYIQHNYLEYMNPLNQLLHIYRRLLIVIRWQINKKSFKKSGATTHQSDLQRISFQRISKRNVRLAIAESFHMT